MAGRRTRTTARTQKKEVANENLSSEYASTAGPPQSGEHSNAGIAQSVRQWTDLIQESSSQNSTQNSSQYSARWADELDSTNPIVNPASHPPIQVPPPSIWDKFNVNKMRNAGFKLDYVAPAIHNGQEIGYIENEDIKSEVELWSNVVACYVLGANPPAKVLNGFIHRVWGKFGISNIAMLKNGILLVRFKTETSLNDILQGGLFILTRSL